MSTFVVFGIASSRVAEARDRAVKNVDYTIRHMAAQKAAESEANRQKMIDDAEARIVKRLRQVPVCAPMDTPQFCRDFIALAERGNQIISMKIMYRALVDKFDKKGKVIGKKKAWAEWEK